MGCEPPWCSHIILYMDLCDRYTAERRSVEPMTAPLILDVIVPYTTPVSAFPPHRRYHCCGPIFHPSVPSPSLQPSTLVQTPLLLPNLGPYLSPILFSLGNYILFNIALEVLPNFY